MGSGGPVLALTHACKMVRSSTLFADCAISRAVISSYPGRGAPAMAALVAVIARIPGTFLDGLLGVVLLVVAQPPQPAPFLGVVLQVGAQRPQPRWL